MGRRGNMFIFFIISCITFTHVCFDFLTYFREDETRVLDTYARTYARFER